MHVISLYLKSLEAVSDNSIILVISDYVFNEINDHYRFPREYFKI